LAVITEKGEAVIPVEPPALEPPALASAQPSLVGQFAEEMDRRRGTVINLGGRKTSENGDILRSAFSSNCNLLYCDIHPGPDVDIVADAHFLSATVGEGTADGLISASVLEHLVAPWIVALEINRVLKIGGLTLHSVPFVWPLHAQPNDFWRMSQEGLKVLFGPQTGFEIVGFGMTGGFSVLPALSHRTGPWLEMPILPTHGDAEILARKVADVPRDAMVWVADEAALRERSRAYPT
jgi:hypothetical protein